MGPAGSIFVVAALLTGQPPGVTIHQDFRNPDCGKTVKVKQDLGGKKIKCPQCGAVVRVPEGSPP